MANLRELDTGVSATIYNSTCQGSHGPRVKHFAGGPKEDAPLFAVPIEEQPVVRAVYKVSEREVAGISDQVVAWVTLNAPPLLAYWYEGAEWFEDQRTEFLRSLRRI